jgi:hypothetical protein
MSKYFNAIVFCLLVLVTASNGLEDGLRSMQSEKPMIVANVNEAMNSSKPIVNQVAKNGKKCCDGEKKECMACKNGMTLDEFCSRLPGKFGCDKSMKKEDRKEQIISEATASPLSVKPTETVNTVKSEGRLYVANVDDTVIDPAENTNCCHSEHTRLACCPVIGEGSPALQGLFNAYKASKARSEDLRKRWNSANSDTKKLEKMVIDQRQNDEDAIAKKAEEKEKYSKGLDIKIPSTLRSNNPKGSFSAEQLAA